MDCSGGSMVQAGVDGAARLDRGTGEIERGSGGAIAAMCEPAPG